MPISAAALSGIAANGRRWKHEIRIAHLTTQIGDFDEDTPEETITDIHNRIISSVESWLTRPTVVKEPALVESIEHIIEDRRDLSLDLEELRYFLNDLFDEFDYYRVVSV